MEAEPWKTVFAIGRNLTTTILENADYVRKEIPEFRLPKDLQGRLEGMPEELRVLGFQTLGELAAVEVDLREGTLEPAEASRRLPEVLHWLAQQFHPVHELVVTLRDAPNEGSDIGSAYVLLAESAANIFRAFVTFRDAVMALKAANGAESEVGEGRQEVTDVTKNETTNRDAGGSMKYYDWKCGIVTCPACGWSGRGQDSTFGELFESGFEYHCPGCEKRLGFVLHPTDEETISDPRASDRDRRDAESSQHREREFERTKLKVPEQLPELDPVPSVLTWDFLEIPKTEHYTVVRNGSQEIWRELAWYEGYGRFGEVAVVLQGRYGAALRDLEPTRASLDYLYGDRMTASSYVERVRSDLARGAYVVRS